MQHTNDFNELCYEYRQHIQEIDKQTLAKWVNSHKNFSLIDVRDADEFEQGSIPGATHLSKGWIEAKIHHIAPDKEAPLVLYCGGGNRSVLAAYNLKKMGYKQVYSLIGGYKNWIK